MKALLTPLMMMMVMMMAASEPTGGKGLRSCRESSSHTQARDLFAWKLAVVQCSEPRTLEFCRSQLDKCRQILTKLHGDIDEQTFKALPGYIDECSQIFNTNINVENFPSTLAELRERCFTLDGLADTDVTITKAFPLLRCVAFKLDRDQIDRFTACINGRE